MDIFLKVAVLGAESRVVEVVASSKANSILFMVQSVRCQLVIIIVQ